jgi:hypothetical protein
MAEKFSNNWWSEFLATTGSMSTPAVFPSCFAPEETRQMRMSLMGVIRDLHADYKKKYGYRLWVGGQPVDDEQEIFRRAPLPGEDLADWSDRVFAGEKFGIILNRGEKFNDDMSSFIARRLAPLIEQIGMPTEGILFTVFIGNYDSTPLGIHKDLPGKSVMHFHLGPGDKTMYCWDDEPYMARAGKRQHNNMDVSPHLDYAQQHTFSEGDIYFMPANRFHLGTQNGLSMGIACWWNNRANADFAHALMTMAAKNLISHSPAMLQADSNDPGDSTALDSTLALFAPAQELGKPLEDVLRATYIDLRYSLYSNGGLRNAPLPLASAGPLSAGSIVCVAAPFRMHIRAADDGEALFIYVRGTRLQMRNDKRISTIVDVLNRGTPLSVLALSQSAALDIDVCLALVTQLVVRKGVLTVNANE